MENQRTHTIIGMAGHIDHGKTELIRAMTGLETDRLKEEKERGITIDLGFAYWKDNVTIIDVPGHEKFIRNMVTGVNAVDLFLLVIAADDGIMPQTREHFEILNFFGVKTGVIALNKIDLVDDEWLGLVKADIKDFLKENGFEDIPIVPVSARNGNGVDVLRNELIKKIEKVEPRNDQSPFRLNIDRSFTLKGHGTVVTGTVLSSSVKVGERIHILPQLAESKVRAIQVHRRDVDKASIGQRAAINIANVTPEQSRRGMVLVSPDTLMPASTLLAAIKTVNKLPFSIKKHASVHVHLGTFETVGKITWYSADKELKEKQKYVVFIKLNEPAAAAPNDPLLLRSFSPVTTIAGGKILQINPRKLKNDPQIREAYYQTLISGSLAEKIVTIVEHSGYRYFTAGDFVQMLFIKSDIIIAALNKLVKDKKLIARDFKNDKIFLSMDKIEVLIKKISELMEEKKKSNLFKSGFNVNEIYDFIKKFNISEKYLDIALQIGINKSVFSRDGERYRLKDDSSVNITDEYLIKTADLYLKAQFTPPTFLTLADALGIKEKDIRDICNELNKQGYLVSISGQFYLHRNIYDKLIDFLRNVFSTQEYLKISDIRDFTKSSRKFIIPIMEYLDQKKYTVRSGEERIKGENL